MEQTLVIIKPSAIQRDLIGEIISRFQRKGLLIVGLKMMQLNETILREHYAHLVDKPFFPWILNSMMATPVIVMAIEGNDAVNVVRTLTGATNGRKASPGTIRGDYSVSSQENIVHASDSIETAKTELARFFSPSEIFHYKSKVIDFIYAPDEQ
jgi:nucleoside-diphosphate kinase